MNENELAFVECITCIKPPSYPTAGLPKDFQLNPGCTLYNSKDTCCDLFGKNIDNPHPLGDFVGCCFGPLR